MTPNFSQLPYSFESTPPLTVGGHKSSMQKCQRETTSSRRDKEVIIVFQYVDREIEKCLLFTYYDSPANPYPPPSPRTL